MDGGSDRKVGGGRINRSDFNGWFEIEGDRMIGCESALDTWRTLFWAINTFSDLTLAKDVNIVPEG